MKCQSYFPVYRPHYDRNVDANGGASPMYNDNATFRSGHYNEYVVAPLPLPRGPSFAYKELLRQTMLLQEDTFKDQVQELHRLYRRQKELMGEIKGKYIYMNHLHLEEQSSNSTSAKISVRNSQNALLDLPFINSHSLHNPTGPVASRNGGTLKDLDFADSKGKKIRGKLLDLELPAEVYIDSDEEESLQATPPTALFSNKRAKVLFESDVKLSTVSRSLNAVLQGELPSNCSFSPLKTNLVDLNESLAMLGLEESSGNKATKSGMKISEKVNDCSADMSTMTFMAQSSMAKSQVGPTSSGLHLVQALPSMNSEFSSIRGAKISGRQKMLNKEIDATQWCSPDSNATRSLRKSCPEFEKSVFVSPQNLDLNSIDLNSGTVSNPESTPSGNLIFTEGEALKKRQRCRMIDINLPCDPTADDEPCDIVPHDYKNSGQINLNSGQTRLEIDLEAPISPEVEECPPPRGESEENQSEAGCEPLTEIAKIAAETIVSISSSQYIIPSLQKCEASNGGNLEWFADVISSLSFDIDNDFETMSCNNSCSIIDDYEAMTLELTEMKVEDYWCKTTVQISTESCSTLLPCQTRKGRTRRSKRKDFRREVLPSLASLSRYEVTEDIQMIEGLMEAAGTPWQLSRTRRACRVGRKPRAAKQQTTIDEAPELMAVMSWGKVNRRCRGRRSSASRTVLSKWLEFVC